MSKVSYLEFVRLLKKPGADILVQQTPEKADLQHLAIGIAGEGGELLDAIKKHTIYDKELDRDNVVEELGDLKFFTIALMDALGITDEEVEENNRQKLGKRYEKLTYSDAAAQARADKQEA